MRAVVTTPTGNIGRPLSQELLDRGVEVTLLARNPEKVRPLAERGARVEVGDLEDRDFVTRTTAGAEVLFWLTPPNYATDDLRRYQQALGRNAAQAVRENAIPRVVHLSSIGAHLESGTGPILGVHDNEGMLDDTPASVTHLRPAYFMENYLLSLETIRSMGSVFMPIRGSVSIPMIATRDIAAAAAECMLDTSWTGRKVWGLHGPRDLSFDEAARILSEELGRPVEHVTISPDRAREAMTETGIPARLAETFLELYASVDAGELRSEMPRSEGTTTPTEFSAFVREVLKPAAGAP
jgi:uncharacterized protein YbjT (DUF2867 family)